MKVSQEADRMNGATVSKYRLDQNRIYRHGELSGLHDTIFSGTDIGSQI